VSEVVPICSRSKKHEDRYSKWNELCFVEPTILFVYQERFHCTNVQRLYVHTDLNMYICKYIMYVCMWKYALNNYNILVSNTRTWTKIVIFEKVIVTIYVLGNVFYSIYKSERLKQNIILAFKLCVKNKRKFNQNYVSL